MTRGERIKVLVEWGRGKKKVDADMLFVQARNRFPYTREKTLQSYVGAAMRILEKER